MTPRYAGLWVRVLAFALDYLLIAAYLILLVALSLALNGVAPALRSSLFATPTGGHIVSFLLVTLPVSLYFALSEASARQATWGKRKMGLQVTDTAGRRLSLARSLGRTVLKFISWELAHKEHVYLLTFDPTDEPTPPPLAADLKWVWGVIGLGGVTAWLVGRFVTRSRYGARTHRGR